MPSLISLIVFIAVILAVSSSVVFGRTLRPGGLNVCNRRYTYNTYYKETRQRIGYVNYRTCCKRFWRICTSRCTRSRTRLVYYTVSKLKVKTSVSYFCCSGWARSGQECPNAICRPSCQNGDCIAPNTCRCRPGFSGKYCEQEINECKASPSPCQQTCTNLRGSYACSCKRGFRKIGNGAKDKNCQNVNECLESNRLCACAVDKKDCKATCVDIIGSYRCQCSRGYRLLGNRICTDVDECSTGTHGCQQICLNLHGGFKCDCRKGYWLRGDKRTCHDLNECRLANGGCEQICTNTAGSYRCSCRKGFFLAYDKTRCTDVDECLKFRPCDRLHGKCQNRYGSYVCLCNKGYQLQNGKKCIDINECHGVHECQQNCHNAEGSYFCSCRKGFSLAADRKSCVDIDECKKGLHNCDQICINNFGSYRCQCKAGYVLQDNKKTCRALPCKKLYPPHHGFVRCMGLNLGQKCTYSCRTGYKVIGSRDRTCQLSSRWSGGVARCYPKSCQPARPPINGFLSLPCVAEYKSTCIVSCKKGYLQSGSSLIKCGLVNRKVEWQNNDAKCTEIKLCQPSPCKNGGKCKIKSNTGFECDCSGTGYTGENCQFGMINITPYPPLALDKESRLLTITAKPAKELVVTPEAVGANVVFSPKRVIIRHPRSYVQFKLIPRSSGLIRIKYRLSGHSRLQFSPLEDSVIYVSALEASEKISRIPDKMFAVSQCNKLNLDKCSDGKSIELFSSCPWTKTGTNGYQSISVGGEKIPLSLAGVSFPDEGISSWAYRTRGVLTVSKETSNMLKKGPDFCGSASSCKGLASTKAEHRFLIKQNLFTRSVLYGNSKLTPKWLDLHVKNGYTGFHVNNIQSMVLRNYRIKELPLCFNFPKSLPTGVYASQVVFLPIIVRALSKKSSTESTFPTCIATNVCKNYVYYSLPKDKTIDLASDLRKMNIASLQLRVHGFGFGGKSGFKRQCWKTFSVTNNRLAQDCFNPKIFLKVSGGLSVGLVNLTMNGDAHVSPSNLESAAVKRFSVVNKYSFQGHVMGSLAMKIGGKIVTFQIQDLSAEGFGHIGGVKSDPLKNTLSGFHFKTSSNVLISHESLVTFHPISHRGLSEFQFRVLSNVNGGDIYTVKNAAKIRLMMRSFSRSLPSSATGILMSLRRRRSSYSAEYAALESFKNTAGASLQRIKNIVSKPNVDYKTVENALSQLRDLTEAVSDVVALLESRVAILEKSFAVKRSILMRIRFMKRVIKSSNDLSALPKSRPSSESHSGLIIRYTGRLCFHALCFDKMRVAIFDLESPNNLGLKNPDSVLISATFTENQSIAGMFNVTNNTVLRAEVSRHGDFFTAKLPGTTKIFGKRIPIELQVTPTAAGFSLQNFELAKDIKFNLDVSAKNSKITTWQSLFFSIVGVSTKESSVSKEIEKLVTQYVTQTSALTKQRLGQAFQNIKKLVRDVSSKKAFVKPKKTAFELAEREFKRLKGAYNRSLAHMGRALKTFRSYRLSEVFQNIEKKLNQSCSIAKCKEVCMPVPICGICQEAIMVDANTLQCDIVSKKATTTVEQPLESQCQLTDYRFTPIYTGTCKKGKDAKLTAALSGIGAGIGFLAGGPIGAAVGGIIGAIGGLFSSCDESYEVYKEVINRQVSCTRKILKPKTTFWKAATCFTLKKNVLSGYNHPKECDCNNNTCVVVQNPICLKNNSECVDERRGIVKGNLQKAGTGNNSYEQLEDAQNAVRLNFTQLLQGEKKYLFAKRDYEKASALLRQGELEVKLANLSLKNSNENFALELCMSLLKPSSEGFLKITKIAFDSSTSAQENVLFRLQVQRQGSDKMLEKSFLFDLKDSEVSLKRGAKRLAREIFCAGKYRRRRSVKNSRAQENTEGLFIQNTTTIPTDASDAKRACLVSKTVFSFLKQSSDDLMGRLRDAQAKKRDVDQTIKSINSNVNAASSPAVNNQNQMLALLKDQLQQDTSSLTAWHIIQEWLGSMETATGVSNFTRCLNFEDCIHEAYRQLKSMPSLISLSREEFHSMIDDAEMLLFKVISARSFSQLQSAANLQRNNLGSMMQASLFCAEKPEVKLVPVEKIAVTVGSVLRLQCSASSLLPVEYSWSHNNANLLSQDSNTLEIKIESGTQGIYRCMVSNLAGKTTSQDTYVAVRESPSFLNEPQDFQYYSSMAKEITPHFACNVTSDPPSVISWYFQAYGSSRVGKFAYSKPVLRLGRPTIAESGHYFCTAENQFGKITSRKARLDVLKSRLPNQAFSVSFNVQVGRSGAPGKAAYERQLQSEGKLTASQDLNVGFEYQSGRELNVNVKVTDNLEKNMTQSGTSGVSGIEMLRVVSKSRLHLSGVMERIVEGLTRNRGRSANDAMEKSMRLGFNGNLCRRGYFLHENGFTCVECPTGSYEHNGKCINCSIGTYQSEPGQISCMKCEDNQVTESVATVSKYQCISPEIKSTDVIFALDSSSSIGTRNWRNVKAFVAKFAQDFVQQGNDLKVGIVTFDTIARVRIPLRRYNSWQLQSRMQYLSYYGGVTRTSEGLIKAGSLFKRAYQAGRKQILFVMTDGKSTTIGGIPGFILARRAALDLLRRGIHIVSVGVGSRVDPVELQAIASYPKQENVIRYGSFHSLISASKRISATALRGICFSQLKDIAIVVEGSSAVRSNRWRNAKEFVSELLTKLAVTSDNKLSVSTFSSNLRNQGAFKELKSAKEIKRIVRNMVKDGQRADYRKTVQYIYNQLLNEKAGSMSSTKLVIFLTKNAFDRSILGNVRRDFPKERVRFFTVTMNLKREENFNELSNAFEEQTSFSMTQLSSLVKAIEQTNFSRQKCQADSARKRFS